ncbi:hypothetical protein [Rahnella laticis]|uniref:hypothetical protein n=1 Tax=Rahnella laticis TaxID=2787622 RepID=UPI0018A32061|nr:hypothetical protein [Rahnella laticis]MBF7997468.1 hypothetical protein [Rahnella laticis]
MNLTVNRYNPPGNIDGVHYLISIVKDVGLECKFVVEIAKLPEEMHPFFYDQYNAVTIENTSMWSSSMIIKFLNKMMKYIGLHLLQI